ncbi:MAG: DUF72 domain-containing protein [Nitrospirae bacterium]|nr:DUF72 domain-containing protein [Nitrospirota bacterium]
MPDLRVGCSGFSYRQWKGNFYPEDLSPKQWLRYYATVFNAVELNVTFYRLPLARTFEQWYGETPTGFVFLLKGSRYITHIRRLLDPREPLETFFERALRLQDKLKVVLWQFSPGFGINKERLKKFLALLKKYPVRNTLEFRNRNWITDEVIGLCRDHDVSLCMADWPEFIDDLPTTADFVYMRRHGEGGDYASDYPKAALVTDAERIRKYLTAGKDVYICFNNDARGFAPKNARELMELLKTG